MQNTLRPPARFRQLWVNPLRYAIDNFATIVGKVDLFSGLDKLDV